ncbi:MAG: hypothetical protein R3F19_06045 [Verrucomicrobiales bacterium]
MTAMTHRTLTSGRILALSRQGQRWWPHNDSPSYANSFRQSVTMSSNRYSQLPSMVAVPLVAAGVAALISAQNREPLQPTYIAQAPVQTVLTGPVASPAASVVVAPIANRDANARDFLIPYAVPVAENERQETAIAELVDLPPVEEVLQSLNLDAPLFEDGESGDYHPTSTSAPNSDPIRKLDLAQERVPEEVGPSTGLLPELDDPLAMEDPELMSVQEIADLPRSGRPPLKLTEYQKEFPEIFAILGRGSSAPASTPFSKSPDTANKRRAQEAVRKAEEWRTERNHSATNQRRPKSLIRAVKNWIGNA